MVEGVSITVLGVHLSSNLWVDRSLPFPSTLHTAAGPHSPGQGFREHVDTR